MATAPVLDATHALPSALPPVIYPHPVHGVSMWAIRSLVSAVERRGVSIATFLEQTEFPAQHLADDARRVPYADYRRMVRTALAVTRDPALGLHVGVSTSIAAYDVIGPLVQLSGTIRNAVAMFERYALIVTDGPRLELHEEGDVATLHFLNHDASVEGRFFAELGMSALVTHLVPFFIGPDAMPRRTLFAHPAPGHRAAYTHVFAGRESFEHAYTGLELERSWLDRPCVVQSPELSNVLRHRAEFLLKAVARDVSAAIRVRRWLGAQSLGERPMMDDAARALGVSVRTLRRALAREKTSYQELVDESLAKRASELLKTGLSSVQEVAYELGFGSPAAFSRAFKRWTGMTPGACRSVG